MSKWKPKHFEHYNTENYIAGQNILTKGKKSSEIEKHSPDVEKHLCQSHFFNKVVGLLFYRTLPGDRF